MLPTFEYHWVKPLLLTYRVHYSTIISTLPEGSFQPQIDVSESVHTIKENWLA